MFQKSTTSPLTVMSGVLLLQKEEKFNILKISNFPSFSRRGVIPGGL